MKKSICRIFFACLILILPASAQQVNQDIIPASTGLNLGHSNQRWNANILNLDVTGTCKINGAPCAITALSAVNGTANQITATTLGTITTIGLPSGVVAPGTIDFQWAAKTVATLPAAASNTGRTYRVTDGASATDCTTGLGSYSVVCTSDGSVWGPMGSAGGGTPGGSLGQPQYNGVGAAFKGQLNTAISTAFDWTQTGNATDYPALTGGASGTVTLRSCPTGLDYGGTLGYQVYISDGASSESVNVSSGTSCSGNAQTITFTPYFNHVAGAYTIKSASTGIQEALNATCGISSTTSSNRACRITVPPSGPPYTNVTDGWGRVYIHANNAEINGYGVTYACHPTTRGPCFIVGSLTNANSYNNITIKGFGFRAPDVTTTAEFTGSLISNTVRTTGVATITTAANHNLRNGDMVNIQFTDFHQYTGDVPSITVTGTTTFTYTRTGAADLASWNGPGIVALAYEPILDNAQNTHIIDVTTTVAGQTGHFNGFFDFWDDENAIVDGFNNNGISLNLATNFTGSFFYGSPANNLPSTTQQNAAVVTINSANVTANGSNCFTATNSNGWYINNSVCQATGPWEARISNVNGNYQGASFLNLYSESAPLNPSGYSPWGGLGGVGLLAGGATATASFSIRGNGTFQGTIPSSGSGSTIYCYFIVANDTTSGGSTDPLPVACFKQSATQTNIVNWPRIKNDGDTITYDVLRVPEPNVTLKGAGIIGPYTALCTGGAPGTCGSVVTGQAQGTGFIQTFSDDTSLNTTSYTVASPSFGPSPDFWPGTIITTNTPIITDVEQQVSGIDFANGAGTQISSNCKAGGGFGINGGQTTCLSSQSGNGTYASGKLFPDLGGNPSGATAKGLLNFGLQYNAGNPLIYPHDYITLIDSNIIKTKHTNGYRPTSDAADTAIGTDVPSATSPANGQLSFSAAAAISSYINAARDNTSWLERLTSSLKSFTVPIKTTSYLDMAEIASPGNPAAGVCRRYVDSTSHLVTYLNSSGTSCFGGAVTGSGVANQVATFTAGAVIGGNTDFLYTAGSPNKLTVPGNSLTPTLIFSGTNNAGMSASSAGVLALFAPNNVASSQTTNFYRWSGAAYVTNMQFQATATSFTVSAQETGENVNISGKAGATANASSVALATNGTQTATSGVQVQTWSAGNFAPTSGTAVYHGLFTNPVVNQTGGANGTIRIGAFYPVNTALVGTEYLIAAGTAASQAVNAVLTDKFTVDSSGNVVSQGKLSSVIGLNLVDTASPPAAASGNTTLYSDSTSHRPLMNPNNTGALSVVGITTPATSGNCAKFAANGIDVVDNGTTCGGGAGTVTHTGNLTAGQVVIGNGTADEKIDTGCSTDGAGAMTCASFTATTSATSGLFGTQETFGQSACETAGAPTTLATGSTTTDTGLTCLPATAVIDAVVYRITTTITTAASFTIGDATTAGRFCGTQSTLTAGTTGTCFVQADQTGAAGPRQTTAVAVRVTTNVNPGAGAIRLLVYYHTWTPPTS